jgi:aldehyde dehydrogenase
MTREHSEISTERITDVVADVLTQLERQPRGGNGRGPSQVANPPPTAVTEPRHDAPGVFRCVDAAVEAATAAQQALTQASMTGRGRAVDCIRRVCRDDAEELGRLEFEETGIGRLEHKIEKLPLVATVPGIEMVHTEAVSGDHGLTVTERAPYGVIAAITPVTHSVPTLASNAIMMIAAGNAVVCNPHPGGAACVAEATRRWNRAIRDETGIENLICTIEEPTLETAAALFEHPGIAMLCVTGGPGLARAAMQSSKKAIVAGPGNPPVVVDETADMDDAAQGIILGAAYDNNLLCIAEKEVFVVDAVADALLSALERHGGYRLSTEQMDRVAATCIHRNPDTGHYVTDKDYIGRDPQVIAQAIGISVPGVTQLLFGETRETNPLVPCEQMMPVLPVVRVRDVDEAIEKAVHYEHGFRHTAIMWSRDIDHLTRMGQACNATIFVKNGACVAGLGVGGEGYLSFSTASPTGEGVTNPLTFTRYRRCVMVDRLRIV